MGDFVLKSTNKSATRKFATPIESATAFAALVTDILTNNPFECTSYTEGGVSMDAVEKTRESWTARFAYEDNEAITIGTTAVKCPTQAAFNAAVTAVPAATALNTAIGATGVHNSDEDSFSTTIRCHDANGEIYNISLSRTQMSVTGYSDDAILANVETWADTKPGLA